MLRRTSLAIVGCLVVACSTVTPSPSPAPAATAPAASPPSVASPTPAPSVASSPIPSRRPEPTALGGLPVDPRRVLASADSGCTGGPVGGDATETSSYDFWTLHCPAGDAAGTKLLEALKAELEVLGAELLDEGEVSSGNAGNRGDRQVSLHGQGLGIDITIRATALRAPNQSVIVVTIEQRQL
jgi:hypothetical protein